MSYGFHMESHDADVPRMQHFWRTDDGLTATERAEAFGVDLSLLAENLKLTPYERIQRNDRAVAEVERLAAEYVQSLEGLNVFGDDVMMFTLNALVAAKCVAGRPRDLLEVEALEELRRKIAE